MVYLKKDEIISLLMELKDYMDSYADVDGDSEGNYPNKEASFMAQIDLAIETLERSELSRDKMNESKRKTIRLSESQLTHVIKNAIQEVIGSNLEVKEDKESYYIKNKDRWVGGDTSLVKFDDLDDDYEDDLDVTDADTLVDKYPDSIKHYTSQNLSPRFNKNFIKNFHKMTGDPVKVKKLKRD